MLLHRFDSCIHGKLSSVWLHLHETWRGAVTLSLRNQKLQ